jgi:hypothetical protein
MASLRRILREPLLHFLLAGGALYLLHGLFAVNGEDADSRHIVVDRPALLRFMQYQARAFEPESFAASFDAMGAAQRRQLIDQYVREEVLYREAQALGLTQGDYVMRQRLVQKMSFLLEAQPEGEPAEIELQEYLKANEAMYRVEPSWTFTHVFVDPALHGGQQVAGRAARALLATLNARRAAFNDAPAYGDRFAFTQNYVERTTDFVASHFGAEFAAALQDLPVDATVWQGPLRSNHGWHLVMLTAHSPGRIPSLAEVRMRVQDDFLRERATALQEQALRALVDGYDVELRGLEAAP